jgi:hypothetical protein
MVPSLVLALAANDQASQGCPHNAIDNVSITAHSDRPTALSTYSLVWIVVSGKTPQEQQLEFYLPYMAEEQFVPPVNSICKIRFHTDFTSGGSSIGPVARDAKLKIIDEIACDTGTFLMK